MPARLKRRWLPWALVGCVLLVWAVVITIAVAVVGDDIAGLTNDREIEIDDGRAAVELTVPSGVAIESVVTKTAYETCPMVAYYLSGPRRMAVQLELPAADCRIEDDLNENITNGRHGVYRTIGDVAAAQDVSRFDTELGAATVFTQKYVECTNSCTSYQEPVAIIELAEPASSDYPTLVLRGFRDELTREQLEVLVRTAELPD